MTFFTRTRRRDAFVLCYRYRYMDCEVTALFPTVPPCFFAVEVELERFLVPTALHSSVSNKDISLELYMAFGVPSTQLALFDSVYEIDNTVA